MQDLLSKVRWGEAEVDNRWAFEYLGALFQPDGDQMPDVQRRCGMAKTRTGTRPERGHKSPSLHIMLLQHPHVWVRGMAFDRASKTLH